jgi:hypothetical protein
MTARGQEAMGMPVATPAETPIRMQRRLLAAGLVMLVLLGMAGLGLFALHRAQADNAAAAAQLSRLHGALDTARQAEAGFKRQVQEWKNILLRGQAPDSRPALLATFQAQRQAVADLLAQLAGLAPPLADTAPWLEAALPPLAAEHAGLNVRYDAALAGVDLAAPEGPAQADAAMRGADRALEQSLDALGNRLAAHFRATAEDLAGRAADRYAAMRQVLLFACGGGLLLVLGLLFALLRPARRGGR